VRPQPRLRRRRSGPHRHPRQLLLALLREARAAEGCYDGAKAYRTPFVSGKDSLNNQFTTEDGRTIEIPPTLLITGIGIVPSIDRVVTMDVKSPGHELIVATPGGLVGTRNLARLGGSRYASRFGVPRDSSAGVARVDLERGPRMARRGARLVKEGLVESVHDVSDGGVGCAIAEMLIAGSTHDRPIGAEIDVPWSLFAEMPSTYVLEVRPEHADRVMRDAGEDGWTRIGRTTDTGTLEIHDDGTIGVDELAMAWRGTLDW